MSRRVWVPRGTCSRCGPTFVDVRGSRIIDHHPELQRQLVQIMGEDYEFAYYLHEPDSVTPSCDRCHSRFHFRQTEPLFERYWGMRGLRDFYDERVIDGEAIPVPEYAGRLLGSACSAAWWDELDRSSWAKRNGRLRWNPLPEGRDNLNVPPPDDWSYSSARDPELAETYNDAIEKLEELLEERNVERGLIAARRKGP